jgi:hypothetical protein
MWEALTELEGISKVGVVFILAALTTCILACAFVIYDTARDTYRTIQELRKNRKTKN